jgi:hypothetical protein
MYVEGEFTLDEIRKGYGQEKTVLRLRFILPKIHSVFGVWEFTTHGVESSIPAIRDAFDTVQSIAGSVVNIAFDLHVEKVESNKPGEKTVFPVVSLIANICKENMEQLAAYYEQGRRLRGVINDERISSLSLPEISNTLTEEDVVVEGSALLEVEEERLLSDEEKAEINRHAQEKAGFTVFDLYEVLEDMGGYTLDTLPASMKQDVIDNILSHNKENE